MDSNPSRTYCRHRNPSPQPKLPVFIDGVVGELSCPHCQAGIEYTVTTGRVVQVHNDRWCPVWQDVAEDWAQDDRVPA